METKLIDNSTFYGMCEKSIIKKNIILYNKIIGKSDLDIPFKQKFYMYENSMDIIPVCECGGSVKFIDMRSGFREFCSSRCMYDSLSVKKSRIDTNFKKYGVDNPSKSILIKDKVKKTNLKKYGVNYPLQSKNIVEKSKKIFIDKYGVDNPSKVREIREKAEKTMLDKYGVNHAMKSDIFVGKSKRIFMDKYGVDNPSKVREIREKAEKTMLDKYGTKNILQNSIFMNKLIETNILKYGKKSFTMTDEYKLIIDNITFLKNSKNINDYNYKLIELDNTEYLISCNKCNSNFSIQRQLYRNRIKNSESICIICNPILSGKSNMELNLLDFIKLNYNGKIKTNIKSVIDKEIDIYLPELNLAFEFNGLYWHSELFKDRKYHLKKTKDCLDKGIQLVHVWEDDWIYKQNIVKSIILNKLGKSKRIFARKCEIKVVDNKEVRTFLENNHIQGFVGSKVKIGLYFNNELVSLMVFGGLRKSLGQINKEGSYELLRFCNKLDYSVVGGAGKLFKYFLNNYDVSEVVSYSDNSRGVGNLYNKLGFNYIHNSSVNYYWCKNGIRYHRFNFRKDKLVSDGFDINQTEVEIMNSRGYFRIFDCGNKKWIYKKVYLSEVSK